MPALDKISPIDELNLYMKSFIHSNECVYDVFLANWFSTWSE